MKNFDDFSPTLWQGKTKEELLREAADLDHRFSVGTPQRQQAKELRQQAYRMAHSQPTLDRPVIEINARHPAR